MIAEADLTAPRSLYLHIPFCSRRCPYCDFAIHVGGASLQERYVDALIAELRLLRGTRPPHLDTIYLGGGTPSLLRPDLLQRLLAFVFAQFGVAADAEVSLEANPESLSEDAGSRWLEAGVNRVSLGVQSLDPTALAWLGRGHDAEAVEAAIGALRRAGLKNLSCDLIYAIPVQGTATFANGLDRVLGHHPQHISCYELTVEPGTPLQRQVAAGTMAAPTEVEFLAQRHLAVEHVGAAGLARYEVSNYAVPGYESRHNLVYWRGLPYLAAGAGAHGFLGAHDAGRIGLEASGRAVRFWHLRDTATYIRSLAAGGRGLRGHEWLTSAEIETERLACGLRLAEGVRLYSAAQVTRARELQALGMVELSEDRVRATSGGVDVLDRLTLELAAA